MARMSSAWALVKQHGTKILAFTSWIFAMLGGVAGSGMFLGDAVRGAFGLTDIAPWSWVGAIPVVVLVGLVVWTLIDIFMDGEPNYPAVISAIFIPSVASASPGNFGARITRWTNNLMDWVGDRLVSEFGTGAPEIIALGCVVVALVLARRVIKKGAGHPAMAGGRMR